MRCRRLKPEARKTLYQEYLKTPHWRQTRSTAIARAQGKCQQCGKSGKLEVHHLTYERLFHEAPEDLIALCPACHGKRHGYFGENDMIDLNSAKTGARVAWRLDQAILKYTEKKARGYLGASQIGDSCQRKLQYAYFGTVPDREPDARCLRIFHRGNQAEAWMLEWLERGGFSVPERQKGFSSLNGAFRGHCDGVISSGPSDCGPYPRLWENKALGHKAWRKIQREGLKKAEPKYYGQVQLYMAYLDLDANPGLFTAIDMDSMEILALDVVFDQAEAQRLSDRAVMILKACAAGEQLGRVSDDPSWWECKMCDWQKRCHGN